MRTEIWVKMDHSNVNGIVLMVANERNVNLIVIDGMISPLDLLHLRGHFGIPASAATTSKEKTSSSEAGGSKHR